MKESVVVGGLELGKTLQVIRQRCQHRGNSSVGENGSLTDISLPLLPISPLIRCTNTKAAVHMRMYKCANSSTPTHFLKSVKKAACSTHRLAARRVSASVSHAKKAGKKIYWMCTFLLPGTVMRCWSGEIIKI